MQAGIPVPLTANVRVEVKRHTFLTSALDRREWSAFGPTSLLRETAAASH